MEFSLEDLKKKRNQLTDLNRLRTGGSLTTSTSSSALTTVNKDLRNSLGISNKGSKETLERRLDTMSKAILPEAAKVLKNSKSHLVFFIDRSNSVSGTEPGTSLGYNNLIKKERESGLPTFVTTILFNQASDVINENEDIRTIEPLDYVAEGGTALYDTLTKHLSRIKKNREYSHTEREKTLVIIVTDGKDKHSHTFGESDVRKIVDACKKLGWEFIFLGADNKLKEYAQNIGIESSHSECFIPDANGYYLNFQAISGLLEGFRRDGKIKPNWAEIIRQNNNKNKRVTSKLENGEDGPTLRLGGRK